MENNEQYKTKKELFTAINNAAQYQDKVNVEVEYRDPTTNEYFLVRFQSETVRLGEMGIRFLKWFVLITFLSLGTKFALEFFFSG